MGAHDELLVDRVILGNKNPEGEGYSQRSMFLWFPLPGYNRCSAERRAEGVEKLNLLDRFHQNGCKETARITRSTKPSRKSPQLDILPLGNDSLDDFFTPYPMT